MEVIKLPIAVRRQVMLTNPKYSVVSENTDTDFNKDWYLWNQVDNNFIKLPLRPGTMVHLHENTPIFPCTWMQSWVKMTGDMLFIITVTWAESEMVLQMYLYKLANETLTLVKEDIRKLKICHGSCCEDKKIGTDSGEMYQCYDDSDNNLGSNEINVYRTALDNVYVFSTDSDFGTSYTIILKIDDLILNDFPNFEPFRTEL